MRYDGGKGGAGVYQTIINLMPPHLTYIEPFIGGGNVMERKKPAPASIAIDADAAVAQYWTQQRVPGLTVIHGDAGSELLKIPFSGNELVYCDPPYLLSTRKGGKIYRHEMTDVQHEDLLSLLLTIQAPVLISGYRSEMYDDMLSGWNSLDYAAMTRQGLATETVWFNYEKPRLLHDYSYVGTNFRERERIKRKKQRWLARLERMDPMERRAILDAIAQLGL